MVKSRTKILVPYADRTHMRKRLYKVLPSNEMLSPFTSNLKGNIDNWQL